jgi:hypothetical protein
VVKLKPFVLVGWAWLFLSGVKCVSPEIAADIVIVTVDDDRTKLAHAIDFLYARDVKLICVNLSLECRDDETDQLLFDQLSEVDSPILPSEILPFGSDEYMDIVGCSLIYPERAATGYTNLVVDGEVAKRVQTQFDLNGRVAYHMTTLIAMSKDVMKTKKFLPSHGDTIKIDFSKERQFASYHFDELESGNIDGKMLRNKIIIMSSFPYDHFLIHGPVRNQEQRYMSTSEIFANIACQIVAD